MIRRKWLIGILVGVAALLNAVAVWFDATRRWDEAQQAAVREAALIGSISRQALAIQNYQFVEYLFTLWGQEYGDVLRIALANQDGTIVVEYSRPGDAKPEIEVQHRLQYGYQPPLILFLAKEGAPVRRAIRRFALTSVTGSLMLGVAIALVSRGRFRSRKKMSL